MSNPATPTLTGIITEDGQCDRCGRELGKVYEVTMPNGDTVSYGRKCAAAVTGWSPNTMEKRAQQARRLAVMAERQEAVAARYGAEALEDYEVGCTISTDALWDGRGTPRWADWTAKLDEVLAA